MTHDDNTLPESPKPAPSLAKTIEQIAGILVIALAFNLLIMTALHKSDPVTLTSDAPALKIAEHMRPETVSLFVVLILGGTLALIREIPRVREEFATLLSYSPTPAPPWGLYDCAKVVAFAIVMFSLAGNLAAAQTRADTWQWSWLCDVAAKGLAMGYFVWILRMRSDPLRRLDLMTTSLTNALRIALRTLLAYVPVHVAAIIVNAVLVAVLRQVIYENPEPVPMQGGLRFLLSDETPWQFRALFAAYAIVGAPILEEFFFRGVLYGALRHHLPWLAAAGFSSLIFGALHGPAYALPLTVLGMLLAVLRERAGSLLVPILLHAFYNGLMIALLFYALS